MKKGITTLVLAVALNAPLALSAEVGSEEWVKELCSEIERTSIIAMRYRQASTPKPALVDIINNQLITGRDYVSVRMRRYVLRLVDRAYEQPLGSSEEIKQDIIVEFADKEYKYCIEGGWNK